MTTCKIPFSELGLKADTILTEIGYGKAGPDKIILDAVEELFVLVKKETEATYMFEIFEGNVTDSGIIIRGKEIKIGKTIASLLNNSTQLALFAATAGAKFENIMQQVKAEGDMLKIYILDVLGSCIAEKAGDYLEKQLEAELSGLPHTNRFSPGYCNWQLTGQREIFHLLGGNPCGIQLTDVCLMLPVKSISGIIGIGERVSQKLYACNICELETCYKRR